MRSKDENGRATILDERSRALAEAVIATDVYQRVVHGQEQMAPDSPRKNKLREYEVCKTQERMTAVWYGSAVVQPTRALDLWRVLCADTSFAAEFAAEDELQKLLYEAAIAVSAHFGLDYSAACGGQIRLRKHLALPPTVAAHLSMNAAADALGEALCRESAVSQFRLAWQRFQADASLSEITRELDRWDEANEETAACQETLRTQWQTNFYTHPALRLLWAAECSLVHLAQETNRCISRRLGLDFAQAAGVCRGSDYENVHAALPAMR